METKSTTLSNADVNKIYSIICQNMIAINLNPRSEPKLTTLSYNQYELNSIPIARINVNNGGDRTMDFIYETVDALVCVDTTGMLTADPNNSLIAEGTGEHKLKINSIKERLFVELGCQLVMNKINDIYNNVVDINGQKFESYGQKRELYERFFKTSIDNFLRCLNSIYYRKKGFRSGIPLQKCIEMSLESYNNSLELFKK